MEPILSTSSIPITTELVEQKHPFSNLQEIRTFITSLQGKRITLKKEQLWKICLQLLSFHPTWKEHLDNIEEIKVVKNKLNDSPCMKIKPTWCKRFILISWRKCVKKKTPKNKKKTSTKIILEEKTNLYPNPIPIPSQNPNQNPLQSTTISNTISTTISSNSVIDLTLDSPIIPFLNLPPDPPSILLDGDPIIDLTLYSPADIEKLDFKVFQQTTQQEKNDKSKNIIVSNFSTSTSTSTSTPQLIKAMRYAIRRQIQKFRKTFTLLKSCVQCQKRTSLQVDHIYPFCFLVRDFLNKKIPSEIPTTFQYKRRTGLVFFNKVDQSFNRSWQIYHRKNATYQWLCKACNISKSNKC